MNFLSRDFLYHRGLSKTTYRGTWNRSNVWCLGSLCLGFQPYFAPNRRHPDHRQYCRSQFGSGLRMEKNFGSGLTLGNEPDGLVDHVQKGFYLAFGDAQWRH